MAPHSFTDGMNNYDNSTTMDSLLEGEMSIASIASSDYVGVILAATPGARLFPLTVADHDEDDDDDEEEQQQQQEGISNETTKNTEGLFKHLLPVVGIPIVCHLLHNLWESGLDHVIVGINHNDEVTVPRIMETWKDDTLIKSEEEEEEETEKKKKKATIFHYKKTLKISILSLPFTCAGSAEALVHLSEELLPKSNNNSPLLVMPGDLILEPSSSVLGKLANAHRKGLPTTAATVLLADIGEEDENGLPLKESSKAKKGGIAREDEDIEFIGLATNNDGISSSSSSAPNNRIILKQSKYDVEEEEENTGSTPKLAIPKFRFHAANVSQMTIRMDWNDVHVYALSPWVLKLLAARPAMKEIQKELLPLLISRQFRSKGIASTFPQVKKEKKNDDNDDDLLLDQVIAGFEEKLSITTISSSSSSPETSSTTEEDDDGHDGNTNIHTKRIIPFSVSAQTLSRPESKLTLRACTIQSYLYACREMVAYAVKQVKSSNSDNTSQNVNNNAKKGSDDDSSSKVPNIMCFPKDVLKLDTKNNSILLASGTTVGDKVLVKSCTIGRNVQLGNRCRLNNVVVMDNVVIGDNCILQNSVLAADSKIGDNCNLNDCQLGPGSCVSTGTKSKGESFMKE